MKRPLHRQLAEQLSAAGFSFFEAPASLEAWQAFLAEVSDAYAESDQRAKTQFLANMSHELRTPLNTIVGFARVLSGGALDGRERAYVENILHAGEQMTELVDDLLDLRRLEEDPQAIHLETVEIQEAIERAVRAVAAMVEERRHVLELDVPSDVKCVRADLGVLVKILVNLLSNAAKFTPHGGRIWLRASVAGEMVHVEVEDTGVGIGERDLGRVFVYFEQLETKQSVHMKGSGVGLALTRALVERQGGTIMVESERGAGSTFTFTVPRADNVAEVGRVA